MELLLVLSPLVLPGESSTFLPYEDSFSLSLSLSLSLEKAQDNGDVVVPWYGGCIYWDCCIDRGCARALTERS
eukprot:scaffold976_cov131-Skeletonema_menzelii.AAC.5